MTRSTATSQSRWSSLHQLHTHIHTHDWETAELVRFVCAFIPAFYSLGQSVLLHDCVSTVLPVQPLPPFLDGGLLQRRTRMTLPSPHVVVHADQGDQRPQFPSAWTIK